MLSIVVVRILISETLAGNQPKAVAVSHTTRTTVAFVGGGLHKSNRCGDDYRGDNGSMEEQAEERDEEEEEEEAEQQQQS